MAKHFDPSTWGRPLKVRRRRCDFCGANLRFEGRECGCVAVRHAPPPEYLTIERAVADLCDPVEDTVIESPDAKLQVDDGAAVAGNRAGTMGPREDRTEPVREPRGNVVGTAAFMAEADPAPFATARDLQDEPLLPRRPPPDASPMQRKLFWAKVTADAKEQHLKYLRHRYGTRSAQPMAATGGRR